MYNKQDVRVPRHPVQYRGELKVIPSRTRETPHALGRKNASAP
jgi:hypothetical protein